MSSEAGGRVVDFLHERDIQVDVFSIGEEGATARGAADALGVPLHRIVKSLLFIADEEPVLVLVSGDRRADSQRLTQLLNAGQVTIASAKQVRKWTGFPPGAVPPLGHRKRLPTWIDARLTREPLVYASAGAKDRILAIAPQDLVAISSAQVAELVE